MEWSAQKWTPRLQHSRHDDTKEVRKSHSKQFRCFFVWCCQLELLASRVTLSFMQVGFNWLGEGEDCARSVLDDPGNQTFGEL
jgi:hypothetical protein